MSLAVLTAASMSNPTPPSSSADLAAAYEFHSARTEAEEAPPPSPPLVGPPVNHACAVFFIAVGEVRAEGGERERERALRGFEEASLPPLMATQRVREEKSKLQCSPTF